MKIISFKVSLCLTLLSLANNTFAAAPTFINLKTNFQEFITEAKDKDINEQISIWQAKIESPVQELYNDLYSSYGDDIAQVRKTRATKWFPFIFENSNSILDRFIAFETTSWPLVQKLAQRFPEVDFQDVNVVSLPNLIMFDGMVMHSGGKSNAMFGLDFMDLVVKNPLIIPGSELVNNLPVIVTHEFTHILHSKISDFSLQGEAKSILEPMWKEGLAVYYSQILNPGSNLENILMEKNLAKNCTAENIKNWAKEFVTDSKVLDESEQWNNYGKWFFATQGQKLGTARAGYCLGYHVVIVATQSHSVDELLKLNKKEAIALAERILESMSNPY